MAHKAMYRLSPRAETDLEDIWLYTFKTWSSRQADAYYGDLVAAFEGLADGRKSGRAVDIRENYFKYAVASHLIFYRLSEDGIDVIRILHQMMDAKKYL